MTVITHSWWWSIV